MMFAADATPLIIIASAAVYDRPSFSAVGTAGLIQNCMLIAGLTATYEAVIHRIDEELDISPELFEKHNN